MTTPPDDTPIYPRYDWSNPRFPLSGQLIGFGIGLLMVGLTVLTYGAGVILFLLPAGGLFNARWRDRSFAALAPLLACATVGPGYLLVQWIAGR